MRIVYNPKRGPVDQFAICSRKEQVRIVYDPQRGLYLNERALLDNNKKRRNNCLNQMKVGARGVVSWLSLPWIYPSGGVPRCLCQSGGKTGGSLSINALFENLVIPRVIRSILSVATGLFWQN